VVAVERKIYPMLTNGSNLSAQIGQRVRGLINRQGHTVESFASACGLSRPNIHRICKGELKNLNLAHMSQIAAALNMTLANLIDVDTELYAPLTGNYDVDTMLHGFLALLYVGPDAGKAISELNIDEELRENEKERRLYTSVSLVPMSAYLYGGRTILLLTKATFAMRPDDQRQHAGQVHAMQVRSLQTLEVIKLQSGYFFNTSTDKPKIRSRAIRVINSNEAQ
jgi:transcriptional regulator with XRE-family HTH domain